MLAGRSLIEACKGEPGYRPQLIYPILFCYRHGLEMAMKWIISRYGRYVGVLEAETNHDLWQLWKSCKEVIIGMSGEYKTVTIVEKRIQEFHDLDKWALAFRYPVNKNGALIPLPDAIDLDNLRDVMLGIDHFFVGADAELDDLRSYP